MSSIPYRRKTCTHRVSRKLSVGAKPGTRPAINCRTSAFPGRFRGASAMAAAISSTVNNRCRRADSNASSKRSKGVIQGKSWNRSPARRSKVSTTVVTGNGNPSRFEARHIVRCTDGDRIAQSSRASTDTGTFPISNESKFQSAAAQERDAAPSGHVPTTAIASSCHHRSSSEAGGLARIPGDTLRASFARISLRCVRSGSAERAIKP